MEEHLTKAGGHDTQERWGKLLVAAQAGDAAAYGLFLRSITPFVRAMARRRSWSEDAIEDVVQDVLLTVHRVRHTYEPGRPVKPWLAAIAARRSIDALRKRGRVTRQEIHHPGAYETFADPDANNPGAAASAAALEPMLAMLTPAQKEALELVKLREMSLVEASAASGQSIASLKVNIHRAMKKLRLRVGKDPAE